MELTGILLVKGCQEELRCHHGRHEPRTPGSSCLVLLGLCPLANPGSLHRGSHQSTGRFPAEVGRASAESRLGPRQCAVVTCFGSRAEMRPSHGSWQRPGPLLHNSCHWPGGLQASRGPRMYSGVTSVSGDGTYPGMATVATCSPCWLPRSRQRLAEVRE